MANGTHQIDHKYYQKGRLTKLGENFAYDCWDTRWIWQNNLACDRPQLLQKINVQKKAMLQALIDDELSEESVDVILASIETYIREMNETMAEALFV
ncbi:MAG: hypothetical protein AAF959_02125 [Cyanobacteria bacterium P01_D01_bin.56]